MGPMIKTRDKNGLRARAPEKLELDKQLDEKIRDHAEAEVDIGDLAIAVAASSTLVSCSISQSSTDWRDRFVLKSSGASFFVYTNTMGVKNVWRLKKRSRACQGNGVDKFVCMRTGDAFGAEGERCDTAQNPQCCPHSEYSTCINLVRSPAHTHWHSVGPTSLFSIKYFSFWIALTHFDFDLALTLESTVGSSKLNEHSGETGT